MKRLDQILVDKKIARSRAQAKEHIKNSKVSVNGRVVVKASSTFKETDLVTILMDDSVVWVARSGEKLNGALEKLKLDLSGKTCLDVGQSTGGFTQAMLLKGASEIVGVDVGKDQLVEELRENPRVHCFESTDARDLGALTGQWEFDFFAVDVSFISVLKVMKGIGGLLKKGTPGLLLIKPQFEVGKKNVKKGGLVDEPLVHLACEQEVLTGLKSLGVSVLDYFPTGLKGKNGNQEFICYINL